MQIFAQKCGPALWINPNTGACDQTVEPPPILIGCDPVVGYTGPQCQDEHPHPIIPADSICSAAGVDQYGNPCTPQPQGPPPPPPPLPPPPVIIHMPTPMYQQPAQSQIIAGISNTTLLIGGLILLLLIGRK